MSPLAWAIVGVGLVSAWFYKKSQGASFKGFFAGDDDNDEEV